MFLIWKWSTHLWSGTRCCPKWKNLNILFKCEGRDRLGLYRSGMVNRELNLQVKLLIYRSIYIPVLTYGHMHWVVTARKRLKAQNSLSLKAGWYFPYWEGEDSYLGAAQTRAATPQHPQQKILPLTLKQNLFDIVQRIQSLYCKHKFALQNTFIVVNVNNMLPLIKIKECCSSSFSTTVKKAQI